jgi:hypothetical protein
MLRRTEFRIAGGLVCLAALTAANAGPTGRVVGLPAGPPLAPRTHGFMLYWSKPLGNAARGALKLGFRIEQVRMGGNTGAPDAGDPMQHRALIGWQMGGGIRGSEMHLELGSRMAYDLKRGEFSLSKSPLSHRPPSSPSGR